MILWRFPFIILLSATILSAGNAAARRDSYSPENVREFADFLFEQEDYLRAVGEYQRYLFYLPFGKAEVHYKIGLCYRLGGKSEDAIEAFENFLKLYPDSQLSSNAHYQIGVSYFLMERFPQSINYLDTALPHIADVRHHAQSQELIGLSYLMQKKWLEADKVFLGLIKSDIAEIRTRTTLYHSYASEGMQLPRRSPVLAGVLSTVLPGSGRFYTGRLGDALASLLTVSFIGWQAYDGFRRDGSRSVKGWAFGTLSGMFYVGNIYGSAISARVYNRRVDDEFLAMLSSKLPY